MIRYENETSAQAAQINDYKKQLEIFKKDLDDVTESRVQLLGMNHIFFAHLAHPKSEQSGMKCREKEKRMTQKI